MVESKKQNSNFGLFHQNPLDQNNTKLPILKLFKNDD